MAFAYFLPTMVKLLRNQALAESQAVAIASRWVKMSYVRYATILIAWLAALRAFSLLYAQVS